MALYQPVTQHPQVMPQLQYAVYMDNQGNVNWNFIQYQQLLLHQNLTPFPVTILAIPQQPYHSTNIIQHVHDKSLGSPSSIDSMSPSTISTLLNAPEFIPTPKSESCDNGKFKALNANCDAFLPGVAWRKSTCTQLSAIKEDEYYEQE